MLLEVAPTIRGGGGELEVIVTTGQGDWRDVCAAAELPPGGRRVFKAGGGVRVALFRVEGGAVRAVDDVCPHEGYPLSDGELAGETLTCCWHAFRFDLRDGACLKGDEAVRAFATRVADGRIEVDVSPPDPAAAIAARWVSLLDGALAGREGQVVRDVARLRGLGVGDAALARWVVAYDAERGEYGTTHVLPVAADVLTWSPRHEGDAALLAVLAPFEVAVERHVRQVVRPTPAPARIGADVAGAGERLRARVEAADVAGAEAILRGALAEGVDRATIERWLYRVTCDHFLDIGHHLIYQVKAFDLLDVFGWEAAAEVLPAHLVAMVDGTRHDTLPRWRWLAVRAEREAPRFEALLARGLAGAPDVGARDRLLAALEGDDREGAVDAVLGALDQGVALTSVVDALSLGAARRILRFDADHDADPTLQDDWLDVTHAFTYVNALRHAAARFQEPALLRHVLYATRYVQALTALDGPDGAATWAPPASARAEVEAGILAHPDARPIVLAHLVKIATAAYDEAAATGDDQPLAALSRLMTTRMRQRPLPRRVHEARRLLEQGRVPRTRL